MSKQKTPIEERYAAVKAYQSGELSTWQICQRFHVGADSIKLYVKRYEKYGLEGLIDTQRNYSDEYILAVLSEYETNGLTLDELSSKYLVSKAAIKSWLMKYEQYKAGDKFAFNGGRSYTKVIKLDDHKIIKPVQTLHESEERKQRREALSHLTKKELYELLLDREAELELIKKVEALVEERESRLRAIGRKLSKD